MQVAAEFQLMAVTLKYRESCLQYKEEKKKENKILRVEYAYHIYAN
jgi:hypothetical protein